MPVPDVGPLEMSSKTRTLSGNKEAIYLIVFFFFLFFIVIIRIPVSPFYGVSSSIPLLLRLSGAVNKREQDSRGIASLNIISKIDYPSNWLLFTKDFNVVMCHGYVRTLLC